MAMFFHPAAFEGKVIGITGGGRGLGLAAIRLLSSLGAHIFTVERDDGACARLEQVFENTARPGLVFRGDITAPGVLAGAMEKAAAEWGGIDGWVNNAAINFPAPFAEVTEEDFEKMLAVNLRAAWEGCRLVRPWLIRSKGSVVNVSSIMAIQPNGLSTPYALSKGALESMTGSLALELAPHSVRVNAIRVGHIDGGLECPLPAEEEGRLWREYYRILAKEAAPWPREGRPEDFANAVAFLLSGAAGYITGATLALDGGYSVGLRPVYEERRGEAYFKLKAVKQRIAALKS